MTRNAVWRIGAVSMVIVAACSDMPTELTEPALVGPSALTTASSAGIEN